MEARYFTWIDESDDYLITHVYKATEQGLFYADHGSWKRSAYEDVEEMLRDAQGDEVKLIEHGV